MATSTDDASIALAARDLTKIFGGFKALDGVSLTLHAGEVHGLMGENGAGKSTLIKALTGFHQPDGGGLFMDGQPVHFADPRASQQAGVSAVYQEVNLIPERSVAENISLGHEPRRFGGLIDRPRMHRDVQALLAHHGIQVAPDTRLGSLGLGMQQMVSIARAISLGARVVILDEPTSALSGSEVDLLFQLIQRLRDDGVAILFVSHRLSECYALCDRLTVLRDGRHVCTERTADLPQAALVNAMLGRERDVSDAERQGSARRYDEPAFFQVKHLHWGGRVLDVSLDVHAGEVVGLVGLLGAGRTETFKAAFGAESAERGLIKIGQDSQPAHSPAASISRGMAFLPEDRRAEGIFAGLSIRENMTAPTLSRLGKAGFISRQREAGLVNQFIQRLRIKASGPSQPIAELSGGNQQKVLLARCLSTEPRVLLLDDPTRGIDVGAKDEVHDVIRTLADDGLAVLVTSSEIEELLAICDRLVVMNEGRIHDELATAGLDSDAVLAALARAAGSHAASAVPS